MDLAAAFIDLHHQCLPLRDYSAKFCELVEFSNLDDASLKNMYWVGTQGDLLLDLPEVGYYSWREYVCQCIASIQVPASTYEPSTNMATDMHKCTCPRMLSETLSPERPVLSWSPKRPVPPWTPKPVMPWTPKPATPWWPPELPGPPLLPVSPACILSCLCLS